MNDTWWSVWILLSFLEECFLNHSVGFQIMRKGSVTTLHSSVCIAFLMYVYLVASVMSDSL